MRNLSRLLLKSLWGAAFLAAESLCRADDAPDVAAPPEAKAETEPESTKNEAESPVKPNTNLRTKTLGGRQFWADVSFFRGWRTQRNIFTGHHRLLDAGDVRHAWGTLPQCRQKLDEIRREANLAPMSGEAVVLVHGVIRSSKSMQKLQRRLAEAGYTVVPFDYPSTRIDVPGAAGHLRQVLESLEGIERVHVVAFSLGGLVARCCLGEYEEPRLGRLVLVGVPNRGAELADLLRNLWAFKFVYGPAGQQLISTTEGFAAGLAVPKCEFAVIAGGRGEPRGYNPFIPGDDDGTVSVASTRLPGAADFALVPALHTPLIGNSQTLEYALRFLKEGRLREQGDREPIEAAAPPAIDPCR